MAATPNIKNSSKSPDVNVMKQGHTTNGDFGSSPTFNGPGGKRTTRDITIPTAKG